MLLNAYVCSNKFFKENFVFFQKYVILQIRNHNFSSLGAYNLASIFEKSINAKFGLFFNKKIYSKSSSCCSQFNKKIMETILGDLIISYTLAQYCMQLTLDIYLHLVLGKSIRYDFYYNFRIRFFEGILAIFD